MNLITSCSKLEMQLDRMIFQQCFLLIATVQLLVCGGHLPYLNQTEPAVCALFAIIAH